MRQLDLIEAIAQAGLSPEDVQRACRAYASQKCSARRRGIRWAFDRAGWLEWWRQIGGWERRGRGRGYHVMARCGDAGPYAPTNVYPSEFTDNMKFAREQLRLDL
jgi:hypothetical protein